MKQTAVEWLVDKHFGGIENCTPDFKKHIEQAIEMEKEQMRSASCPFIGGWEDGEFEDWYNETFKK